ncbi:MAG: MATE family efflux transporter [Rhodospirillaceae bacterium]|nr:MATE family efflux transporter [Rhodospirillaceae bacterium]
MTASEPRYLHMQEKGVAPRAASNPLLTSPILPTLTRLSLPNMVAMVAGASVAIAETIYVGFLGTASLAGMAMVFPMVMLQQMMSAGAIGGGISSAISRALGSGDEARARALAAHAAVIGLVAGLGFTALYLLLGPAIYRALGGRGEALAEALAYSNVVFSGALAIWFTNTFASVIRAGGNMRLPSVTLLVGSAAQVVLGGGLGLGLFSLPRLGMTGIALGQLASFVGATLFLLWFLTSGRARVPLSFRGVTFRWSLFSDILKVGALACLSSFQTVLTILILTRLVAEFGTEALAGYGIGTRLEFLLIPITFAIGVACVPMVGMAVGAGNLARARRIAWTAGTMAAGIMGTIGLAGALAPGVWASLFTSDPAVLHSAATYLRWCGPAYAFFGLGLCLYFCSQGAGKVLGPVLAGTLRLAVVAAGGGYLASIDAEPWTMFALVAIAMVIYGVATALAVRAAAWGRPA